MIRRGTTIGLLVALCAVPTPAAAQDGATGPDGVVECPPTISDEYECYVVQANEGATGPVAVLESGGPLEGNARADSNGARAVAGDGDASAKAGTGSGNGSASAHARGDLAFTGLGVGVPLVTGLGLLVSGLGIRRRLSG